LPTSQTSIILVARVVAFGAQPMPAIHGKTFLTAILAEALVQLP